MKKVGLPLVLLGALVVQAAGCSNQPAATVDHSAHVSQAAAGDQNQSSAAKEEASAWTLTASVNEQQIIMVDTNLKLSDERYGGEHVQGEGHIHLYVNERLIGPIVAPDSYNVSDIATLKDGENAFKLVLATNNHDESVYDHTTYEFKLMWDASKK